MPHEATATTTPATHHHVATTSGKPLRRRALLQVCAPDTVWHPPSALTTPYGFCHRRPPHRQPAAASALAIPLQTPPTAVLAAFEVATALVIWLITHFPRGSALALMLMLILLLMLPHSHVRLQLRSHLIGHTASDVMAAVKCNRRRERLYEKYVSNWSMNWSLVYFEYAFG